MRPVDILDLVMSAFHVMFSDIYFVLIGIMGHVSCNKITISGQKRLILFTMPIFEPKTATSFPASMRAFTINLLIIALLLERKIFISGHIEELR